MRKLCMNILFIFVMKLCISVYGYFDPLEVVRFRNFDREGCFVEWPSSAGASVGYAFGIVPAAVITEPQRVCNYNQASDKLGFTVLSGCSKTFSLLFGGFPFLLKKCLWDFPNWALLGEDKSYSYYELKPKPLPEVTVDPRLLLEEKHVDLNMQENAGAPVLIEIPAGHNTVPPEPEPQPMKDVKSISEQFAPDNKITFPTNKTISDKKEIILPSIPESIMTDTSISNISKGYSIDTEKSDANPQRWESSGLPDWVKTKILP